MQYLRALQKRSIFLWRSLFSEKSETEESSPVYIERPPAARAAEGQKDTESAPDLGAAVSDQDKSRPIKTDREEKDGAAQLLEKQMLRGLTEAEMWVVSVDDKHRNRKERTADGGGGRCREKSAGKPVGRGFGDFFRGASDGGGTAAGKIAQDRWSGRQGSGRRAIRSGDGAADIRSSRGSGRTGGDIGLV